MIQYTSILRAAELRIPVDVIFSDGMVKFIDAWQPLLRMDSLFITIALLNVTATTSELRFVSRFVDDRQHIPLNLYNMVVARSCILLVI